MARQKAIFASSGLDLTDGTAAGTAEFFHTSAFSGASDFVQVGRLVLFEADVGGPFGSATAIWVTDGTAAGTQSLLANGSNLALAFGGTRAIFSGFDGLNQVWTTDGTPAGTRKLTTLPGGVAGQEFTAIDGLVVFRVVTGSTSALWVSDGTAAGTHSLAVAGANASFQPAHFTVLGGQALFTGLDTAGKPQIWITDGTAAGTHALHAADAPGGLALYGSVKLVTVGDHVFFWGASPGGPASLWVTDGTGAGTVKLPATEAMGITAFGNLAIFSNGDTPWVSDGTAAGTHALPLPAALPRPIFPADYFAFGGQLLFSTSSGLLATDGTTTRYVVQGPDPASAVVIPDFESLARLNDAVLVDTVTNFADMYGSFISEALSATNAGLSGLTLIASGGQYGGLTPLDAAIYGPLGGRGVIQGTAASETITAYGSSNTIYSNGGEDQIIGGDGGYNKVVVGAQGDQLSTLTEVVSLFGRGNVVLGGDENVSVSGGAGFSKVTLGNGVNDVRLGGSYNTIFSGVGKSTIDAGGGNATVYVGGPFTTGLSSFGPKTIIISGQHNSVGGSVGTSFPGYDEMTVTGGSGYNQISTFDKLTLTTDGSYNSINFGYNGGTVTAGSGYDTVAIYSDFFSMPDTHDVVRLAGTHNVVQGTVAHLNVSGGAGSNTYLLDFIAPASSGNCDCTIADSGANNKFVLNDKTLNTVTTGSGGANVTITNRAVFYNDPGYPGEPVLPFRQTTLTFAGINNALTGMDSPVTATGGDGYATYTLGNGDDSITTGGTHNQVTLGTGHSTVAPGGDNAIVVLNGSNAALLLQGGGDKVFLNAGTSGSIGGGPLADLHVYVASGIGAETINGIAADPRAVITLTGGAGGYTSAAQAFAALHSDGAGGSTLAIGAGSLHFSGAAPSSLHPGLFVIG